MLKFIVSLFSPAAFSKPYILLKTKHGNPVNPLDGHPLLFRKYELACTWLSFPRQIVSFTQENAHFLWSAALLSWVQCTCQP